MKDWDMSKIKKYNTNVTQVPNIVLYDPNLSLAAKGLYIYMCSKPDNTAFMFDMGELKEGFTTLCDIRKELKERGYIETFIDSRKE